MHSFSIPPFASLHIESCQPPDTVRAANVYDLRGRLVLPGLIDSHIHVGYLGECAEYIQLAGKCRRLELYICAISQLHVHVLSLVSITSILSLNYAACDLP